MTGNPAARAASRNCAVGAGEKAIVSQNASAASARASDAWKEVAAQRFDVTVLVVVFGGQRVGTQESRDDIDFAPITEQSRSSKLV